MEFGRIILQDSNLPGTFLRLGTYMYSIANFFRWRWNRSCSKSTSPSSTIVTVSVMQIRIQEVKTPKIRQKTCQKKWRKKLIFFLFMIYFHHTIIINYRYILYFKVKRMKLFYLDNFVSPGSGSVKRPMRIQDPNPYYNQCGSTSHSYDENFSNNYQEFFFYLGVLL